MSWSNKYKRSINCDNPSGFSQKAHCAARKKRKRGEKTKSQSPFSEMHEIKSHKTVEQIAKKHRLEVSFVKDQLKMGIPIEHEHTKDKDLATDIALQHLDEIPDYYTRLKKMEASAKKEHKKFKDAPVSEGTLHHWFKGSRSKEGKPGWVQADGSPCANEPGETKTPKCFSSARLAALKAKGKKGESLISSAVRRKRQEDKGQQAKSGGAKPTMVSTFAKGKKDPNYVKAEPGIKEAMELNEAQKDAPGKGSGKKDACYHKVKARYDVWPSAYASGALVKCRKAGAANWGTKSEETAVDEAQKCWTGYKKKGTKKMFGKIYNNCVKANEEKEMIRYCPKCKKNETRSECSYGTKFWDMYSTPPKSTNEAKDHEHSMIRSELSTIISAVKRLKKKMKGEGNVEAWVQSKITKAADYIDTAADYVDSSEHDIKEAHYLEEVARLKSQSGNIIAIQLSWRGKHYVIKMFFPQTKYPTRNEVTRELQKIYPGSLVINYTISDLNMGQPLFQSITSNNGDRASLGPSNNYIKPMGEEVEVDEDWQKVNRQDKTDGLSSAAVKAYRRENPGSKLQTAVTEKSPKGKRKKRRASFCRRMKGMKSKLTSAKTARDPDSRINKALRRWNCN